MEENENISEKERERRRKISEARKKAIEEKRRKGYRAFVAKRRREKRKAETIKRREAEKEKKKLEREKERERKKNLKKRGRHKLRGRPKIRYHKVKVKKTRALPEIKYKIVSCRNGVQNKFIGGYRTSAEAYEVFEKLRNSDKDVIFPSMVALRAKKENVVDEYLLIEKTDVPQAGLRNEYGKIVEQKVNVDGWAVVDKFRYKKEETFWVYGFDSRKDRKTFMWIYENVIKGTAGFLSSNMVLVYKNKLIIRHDSGDIDLVLCKDESDSVRFYNKILEFIKKEKVKNVIMIGDYGYTMERRRKAEKMIYDLTGWNDRKIKRNTTSGY